MKLNEEQFNFNIELHKLIDYIKAKFPNGCECYPDCTGCPFEDYNGNQMESQLCGIIETLGDY